MVARCSAPRRLGIRPVFYHDPPGRTNPYPADLEEPGDFPRLSGCTGTPCRRLILPYRANRAYYSSITLSSSVLKSGAGWRCTWPHILKVHRCGSPGSGTTPSNRLSARLRSWIVAVDKVLPGKFRVARLVISRKKLTTRKRHALPSAIGREGAISS